MDLDRVVNGYFRSADKDGRRRLPPARRGAITRKRWRGCAGSPRRRGEHRRESRRHARVRSVARVRSRSGAVLSSTMRGRRCRPGKSRRRPAQVYFCLPGRWEAEMSSSVRLPVPPPCPRWQGKESNLQVPCFACAGCPRDILSRTRPDDDHGSDRPGARTDAGLTWTLGRQRNAMCVRDRREIVNRDLATGQIP
jgi:hypothetical protein